VQYILVTLKLSSQPTVCKMALSRRVWQHHFIKLNR